jgi:hypothetical protein
MRTDFRRVRGLRAFLPDAVGEMLDLAAARIIRAKEKGGRVAVVTGSGPNIHEGVTTLVAELIHKGIVDAVVTSSAVVGHEMAGTLDRVRRVVIGNDCDIGFNREFLPRGGVFEITQLAPSRRALLEAEFPDGWELYDRLEGMPGDVIIKAAGNMAWPMGLRTEQLAREAQEIAKLCGTTVEHVAGFGADPMTMIGAGARRDVPVVVSIPQLIGGGAAGLAIGDAVPITRRARMVADILEDADVILESAIALSQEIHDGPFETHTGHGIWAAWSGLPTYSLKDKALIRIDLDPNLELAWRQERDGSLVQQAVDRGLPKTKATGIPFRMEMSGFARLEGSIPVTADIGIAWPLMAAAVTEALGVEIDFISAPQETDEGRKMRDWIADHVQFLDRALMIEGARRLSPDGTKRSPAPVAGVAAPG